MAGLERTLIAASVVALVGCGVLEIDPISSGGASGVGGAPGPEPFDRPAVSSSSGDGSAAGGRGPFTCETDVATAPYVRPLDVVFVVDNAPSMVDAIAAFETQLYPRFAYVLQVLGADAQVIVVSDHGEGPREVCIGPPLAEPASSCAGAPGSVPGQFLHYSVTIGGGDGLCRLLDTYRGREDGGTTDDFAVEDDGWQTWMRPEAFRALVMLSDGRPACTWRGERFDDADDPTLVPSSSAAALVALNFDRALRQRDPARFGTLNRRNYAFYSLLGVAAPAPSAPLGHAPAAPLVTTSCPGAATSGYGYQWLSRATGGARYAASCASADMGAILSDVASSMVVDAIDRCALVIDDPETAPADVVSVKSYGPEGERETFPRVNGRSACGISGGMYVDGDTVRLCPESCGAVRLDPAVDLRLFTACPRVE
ncbi:MAG: hypothetical protein AAGN82_06160 [Myxococcota bacterium]